MDAEHDRADELPADPTALGFFFPELTADEARTLDHETLAIAERRVQVIALYRRGRTAAGQDGVWHRPDGAGMTRGSGCRHAVVSRPSR